MKPPDRRPVRVLPLLFFASGAAALCHQVVCTWRLAYVRTATQPQAFLASGESLVTLSVGREGVMGVVRGAPDDWRILFNNAYTLGGSRAAMNQERQAHLPLLLRGEPRHVAVLGVATGSTLSGVVLHLDVERIEVVELSPLALEIATRHFAPFNRGAFRDPRVTTILEDARWLVKDRPGQFGAAKDVSVRCR